MSHRQKKKYTITAIQETYRRRKTVVSHRFQQTYSPTITITANFSILI